MFELLTVEEFKILHNMLIRGWLRAARFGEDIKGSYAVGQEIRTNLDVIEKGFNF